MPNSKSETTESSRSAGRRRARILDAAMGCFIARGFHQASMRDISSAAGVSLGNLYNHFENKEAMIVAIAQEEAEDVIRLSRLIGGNGRSKNGSAATDLVEHYFSQAGSLDSAVLTAELSAEAGRNRQVANLFAQNRAALAGVIQQALGIGSSDKDRRRLIDPDDLAGSIIDLLEGLATRPLLTGKAVSKPERRALVALIETLVNPETK